MNFDDDDMRRYKEAEKHPLIQAMQDIYAKELLDDFEKQFGKKKGNKLRDDLLLSLQAFPHMATLISKILKLAEDRGFVFTDMGDSLI